MNKIMAGALAGAAGTIALDVTTYGDMLARGRASSGMPAEVIRRIAEKLGAGPLAKPDAESDDATKNRRSALGALSGYFVGVGAGVALGLTSPLLGKAPWLLRVLAVSGAAMAASDIPAEKLGATDLKTWGTSGWLSDIVPHVVYGLVAVGTFDALHPTHENE